MVLVDYFISLFSVKAKTRNDYIKEKFHEYAEYLPEDDSNASGMDRLLTCLRDLYSMNTWEGNLVSTTFCTTFIFGCGVGALVRSRERVENFKKKFNHMQFEGQFHASRKLADVIMFSAAKTSLSLGVKFCIIPTLSVTAVCCSLAYRNYVNPLDFALIFGSSCSLYKMNLGIRAMTAAAFFGSSIGLIGGCILWASFKLSGTTVREFRHWATAKHKRTLDQLSDKSWKDWAEKMKQFQSLHGHDKLHAIPATEESITKAFDSLPGAKATPSAPSTPQKKD